MEQFIGGQGIAQPPHLCRAFSLERWCDTRLQNEPAVPGGKFALQHAMLHYHVYRCNEEVLILLNWHCTELHMHHADVDWRIALQSLGVTSFPNSLLPVFVPQAEAKINFESMLLNLGYKQFCFKNYHI